ncbi:MAG: DNA mismatch repair endonuclease MutL [Sphaerochaetaceae bacterium]|nr:DNA mismatch repair endonuclease MutL [Sphaerochaetaceae bacterium]
MRDYKHIRLLDPIVAQRIAAGEVIERPASVVRELIDNAIDAGAKHISVQIVGGGLDRITVIDDGSGIAASDLVLCCRSHATSKVSSLQDLYHIDSMGFRGEALYSIASCSKVTIASTMADSEGHTYVVDNASQGDVTPGGPLQGTRVDVEHLFASIPARRMFLKRPSTETLMCKNTVIEKALAFPEIAFSMYDGETLKLEFHIAQRKQRVLEALEGDRNVIPAETIEMESKAGRFSLYAVASTAAYWRTDRQHIKIYLNKRPIDEYALVQAVSYAYTGMLPGGAFPYCYLFITVDPELVDFNIHPAKREAKIRNKADIHHEIVSMIRAQNKPSYAKVFLQDESASVNQEFQFVHERQVYHRAPSDVRVQQDAVSSDPNWFSRAKELLQNRKVEKALIQPAEDKPVYIGQVFRLFLLAEWKNKFYIIDQHAAHERLLYDEIRSHGDIQPLMIPIRFEVDRDVDLFLSEHNHWYADFGLTLHRSADLEWELQSIPAIWKSIEQDVVRFIGSQTGSLEDLDVAFYASIACHDAIKDGDRIDQISAQALVEKVLSMSQPVCPHGRMFVIELTEEHLKKAVGRII